MFYKVVYNNIIIDILKNPTWVLWLKNSKRFILSDIITANGVISSDKQSVYNLSNRGTFENTNEVHKSVSVVEITESEYNFIKAQLVENVLNKDSEVITLAAARKAKIEEMSAACEQNIVNGFDIVLSDGLSHHFTLDIYDQLKISKLNDRAMAGIEALPYHADGEVCRYFPSEDIIAINKMMEYLVEYHTTYFNSMKVYISNIFNVETILNLTYGDNIPTEHCSVVLKDMTAVIDSEEAV